MRLDILMSAYKVRQGEDYPYQDDIGISICNNIDDNGLMVMTIENIEYLIDKKELKKIIEMLDMEN